jgi:alkylhydroperoxidase family enzyme
MVGCSACLDLGYLQAHNEKLDLEKAREVPRWRESKVFTALERDVLEYAEAVTQTPPAVTDELSAPSQSHCCGRRTRWRDAGSRTLRRGSEPECCSCAE